MPEPLVDLSSLDLAEHVVSEEDLRQMIPHDHEFRLVDGICYLDIEECVVVGYKDWDDTAWWGRGHIPGRPIMPGVLMVEGCAQTSNVLMKRSTNGWDPDQFIAMCGVDKARFRGMVTPPCRIYFVAKALSQTPRICKYSTQAFVDGKLVFEMLLIGVPV